MKITNDFEFDAKGRFPSDSEQKAYIQGRLDQQSLMNPHFDDDGMEYRGYGLMPYNIRPIQSGIQYTHSVVEYALEFFHTKSFQLWGKKHKTAVLLDGGTSCHSKTHYSDVEYVGTMEQHLESLKAIGIDLGTFYEPDMNNMLSGIFLIADERAFNFRKYPDYGMKYNTETKGFEKLDFWTPNIKPTEAWIESIGGQKNYLLREYLRKLPLWR